MGCPQLERENYEAVDRSVASEEPVHVLIDVDYPEKASMWFYTTASRSDMIITGPTSGLQAEESYERAGGIYTKDFFDSWAKKPAVAVDGVKPRRKYDDGLEP